jgi:hypothetical protein
VASYENSIERKVSDSLLRKFEIAKQIAQLTEVEAAHVQPFMVTGFDLYSMGAFNLRFGALVGIPINYTYTAPDEIPKADITVRGHDQVAWNSEAGQLLQQGLILGDDEQIFGMTRELLELKTQKVNLNTLYASGGILFYYIITHNLNRKLQLFNRPLSLRLVLYNLAGIFSYGFYCFFKDATQVYLDGQIDEYLGTMHKSVVKAGIGYYDKILKKNMAIRQLTGDDLFTALGNKNDYFRTMSLPFTIRRTFFQTVLKEREEKESKERETANE